MSFMMAFLKQNFDFKRQPATHLRHGVSLGSWCSHLFFSFCFSSFLAFFLLHDFFVFFIGDGHDGHGHITENGMTNTNIHGGEWMRQTKSVVDVAQKDGALCRTQKQAIEVFQHFVVLAIVGIQGRIIHGLCFIREDNDITNH